VRVERAEARFSAIAAVLHGRSRFFDRLMLRGVRGEWLFEPGYQGEEERGVAAWILRPAEQPANAAHARGSWLMPPTHLEIAEGDFVLRAGKAGDREMHLAGTHVTVSALEPGEITIDRLTVRRGDFQRHFDQLRGTTALNGTRLAVADLKLAPALTLQRVTTDLAVDAEGASRVSFEFAAFDGTVRGELQAQAREGQPEVELAGTFTQISVASLAQFLQFSEKAGGTIKEGKFLFRGSPRVLEKATVSTRFEATAFQWGNRQWNSLVLGATVVEGRIEIPEFRLQQAHNALTLKGTLDLPDGGTPWWETAFSFDVAGRIANLTELSALFGPGFSDTAGQVSIDGSIRREKAAFAGQLIVAGKQLAYRGVPIDLLNAAIKLEGNDFQVVNFDMARGDDFLRGKGTINILGEKRYTGEVKLAVEDLTRYAPLLVAPIAPAPLAGGLVVNWSGDGTLASHSSVFSARLRQFRCIGSAEVPATLPVDAQLEGSYAPGGLNLGKCLIANGGTKLDMKLASDAHGIVINPVQVTDGKTVRLSGSATLPVDLARWWTAPGVDALLPEAPFQVALTARGMQLDEVARLTGRKVPISGALSGVWNVEGTLRNLTMNGSVVLNEGRIPPNPFLPALESVQAQADLDGNVLRFSKIAARHATGLYNGTGSIDFSTFEHPLFALALHGEGIEWEAGAWGGKAVVEFRAQGVREKAALSGSASIIALDRAPLPDFSPLILGGSADTLGVIPPTLTLPPPLDAWQVDLAVDTPAPVRLGAGTRSGRAELELRFAGNAAAAIVGAGRVHYAGLPVKTEFAKGAVESADFYFDTTKGTNIAAKIVGEVPGVAFTGYYVGTPESLSSTFLGHELGAKGREVNDETVRQLIAKGIVPLQPEAVEIQPDLGLLKTPAASPTPSASPGLSGSATP
jgi:hypothetical protein